MSDWLICGVDHSAHTRGVIGTAARFARDLGLRLMVVYLGDGPEGGPRDRDDATHVSADALHAWMMREPSVRWDTVLRVEYGDPTRELLRLARECDARMLVAASHGHAGLGPSLLRSRSRRPGGKLPCSVLVLPTVAADPSLGADCADGASSVVCGVDDSAEAEVVLAHAAEMAWARGARLMLTHVVQRGEHGRPTGQAPLTKDRLRAGDHLLERLAKQLVREEDCEMRLRCGDPVSEIDRLAAVEDADLIVVGARPRRGLRGSTAGSVSASLAARASRPVLVAPETAPDGRLRRFCPAFGSAPTLARTC